MRASCCSHGVFDGWKSARSERTGFHARRRPGGDQGGHEGGGGDAGEGLDHGRLPRRLWPLLVAAAPGQVHGELGGALMAIALRYRACAVAATTAESSPAQAGDPVNTAVGTA